MELQLDTIYHMDCLEGLKKIPDNYIDSIVTDPPYELGFMNKKWDKTGIAYNIDLWKECLRVLKPGGYLLAFGGTRTYHRIACAIEDAGFEIRDCIMWLYGCVDEKTEILTVEGFKKHNEIKVGDTVFSLSFKDNRIVKNRVRRIFKYPVINETMCLIHNQDTDQLVTLNHRVVMKEDNFEAKYKYFEACNLPEVFALPLSGIYDGNFSVGNDFAELIGWVIMRGNYRDDIVIISVNENLGEFIERIRYVLKKCGTKYSEYQKEQNKSIKCQFYIEGEVANRIRNIIPDKKLNWQLLELPYKEKERLITGLCAGNQKSFYHEDKEQLEIFQALLHLTNRQGEIDYQEHSCTVYDKNATEIDCQSQRQLFKYAGIVWCIETEIGNFIARRNGKIFITGNSGFPKSLDISKAIDKRLGAQRGKVRYKARNGTFCSSFDTRPWIEKAKEQGYYETEDKNPVTPEAKQWNGWGTALKPAYEPIVVARKPLSEKSVADNVLKWGTGGINIDACRIGTDIVGWCGRPSSGYSGGLDGDKSGKPRPVQGRFPANVILDEEAGKLLDKQSGFDRNGNSFKNGVSRFFYCAKASKKERGEYNDHPTVKPLNLIKYLIQLVTPPGGICLDPFEGSGTHTLACMELGFHYLGFEKEKDYYDICMRRIQEFCNSSNRVKQFVES